MAAPQTDPQYKLRFPAELRDRIADAALESGRTMNAEIIKRLQWSFEAMEVHVVGGETRPMTADDYQQAMMSIVKQASDTVRELKAELAELRASREERG